jgi:Fic family protein
MPNPYKVPALMDEFQLWLSSNDKEMHPVAFAAQAHYRLVTIHPFVDGNGRTARLLMNLILMMFGYPPAIIRKRDRLAYISALEKAQLGGSIEDYEKLVIKAANRSLDIYLTAIKKEHNVEDLDCTKLLKIGELAKAASETSSTIRYWTKEGLLEIAELSKGGYMLYAADQIVRCEEIQRLKLNRLSLAEIKQHLT